MGTHSGRKALYARALVEAADGSSLPGPLSRLVEDLLARAGSLDLDRRHRC
jgi:hypothetical protein